MHRLTIVHESESYSSDMTKKKNNAFASYCPYNLGVNFPVYTVVANSLVVLHAHTLHLSIVGCHKNAFTIYGT